MKKTAVFISALLLTTTMFAQISDLLSCHSVSKYYEGKIAGHISNYDYSKHSKNGNSASYAVGDFAHGGIVFWVDETGRHGLVCAREDQSAGIIWARRFIDNEAFGDGLLAGKKNTSTIITAQTAAGDTDIKYAALICDELTITVNGITYDDWYLPSRTELKLMWQNRAAINRTATSNGGDVFENNGFYWSSNEYTDNLAWMQPFYTINQHYYFKSDIARVRAVRAF
jgi:hypothetical protein